MTGQWDLTKRASEVPPVVESSGVRPVSAATARVIRVERGPGGVRKLSPELWTFRSKVTPVGPAQVSLNFRPGVEVVVADVNRGAGGRRDDVGGGISSVDGGDLQGRGVEVVGAFVQWLRCQVCHQTGEGVEGVVGLMRVGRVALQASGGETPREGTSAANFGHIAGVRHACWLSHQADVHLLAGLGHPVEDGAGAVGGVPFLVAGDGDQDGAVGWGVCDKIYGSSNKGRDAGFHVRRPPAVEVAVDDLAAEGIDGPVSALADGHHICVAVKAEARTVRAFAPAGEEVGGAAAVHPRGGKACLSQQAVKELECAAFLRRAVRSMGSQVMGKL